MLRRTIQPARATGPQQSLHVSQESQCEGWQERPKHVAAVLALSAASLARSSASWLALTVPGG
jgi:hypothetical protein